MLNGQQAQRPRSDSADSTSSLVGAAHLYHDEVDLDDADLEYEIDLTHYGEEHELGDQTNDRLGFVGGELDDGGDDADVIVNVVPFRSATKKPAVNVLSEVYRRVSVRELGAATSSTSSGFVPPPKPTRSPDKQALEIAAIAAACAIVSDKAIFERSYAAAAGTGAGTGAGAGSAGARIGKTSRSKNDWLLQQKIRKEALKAFTMAGGPACAAQGVTLPAFATCLELVGIINQHSNLDEREIASKLAERAFECALMLQSSSFSSSSSSGLSGVGPNPTLPTVSLAAFIAFAEIVFR